MSYDAEGLVSMWAGLPARYHAGLQQTGVVRVMSDERELDWEKLAECALGILWLNLHEHCRVWKSMPWEVTDLLHEKGWISDP
ncbi:MAG: DUF6429 family protein, partial [Armatimonadota bacterium]